MNLHHYVDTHDETAISLLHRDRNRYFDTRKQRTDTTPHLSIDFSTGDGRYALITDISEQDKPLLEVLFDGFRDRVENATLTYVRHGAFERHTIPFTTLYMWFFGLRPTAVTSSESNLYADVMTLFCNRTHWVVRRVRDEVRRVASTPDELNRVHRELHEQDDAKLVTTAHTVDGHDVGANPVKVVATTTYALAD